MDIARPPEVAERRKRRQMTWAAAGVAAVLLVSLGLSRLEPAAPVVERATVWTDTVKRGEMLRQVRGLGTLVPEEIRWIAAGTEGRVERRVLEPGVVVEPDSVILILGNPELEQQSLEAESRWHGEEARLKELRVRLESGRLDQLASAARVQSEFHQARLRAAADEELARDGLIASITLESSRVAARELEERHRLEQQRLAIAGESIEAQVAVQQAAVEQARTMARLRRDQVKNLEVRAGIRGVLQQVPVEPGQRVAPGTNLARVAQPEKLKAVIRIAETQARDVQIGQQAAVDTRNGIIPGEVIRIDPAVQNGTVSVDIGLRGELPKGARPDLTVDGTVELERLENVLYVGRPAQGQPDSRVGLFRLGEGGEDARRVAVRLGRASVNTVEIVEGLAEGEEVILSDTSAWDAVDRIRLR